MNTAAVWTTLGGIAAAVAILAALIKISFQLGDFLAELRGWRHITDQRLGRLEDTVYLPRHRERK